MLPDSLCVHKSRLGTRDALLSMPDRLQHCLDSGGEPRVVQVDFSGAFDRITSLSSLMTVFQIWKRKGLSKALVKVDARARLGLRRLLQGGYLVMRKVRWMLTVSATCVKLLIFPLREYSSSESGSAAA